MAWMYSDNVELGKRNYRWWCDSTDQKAMAYGDTAQDRLMFFWRTHQAHIKNSDSFFESLFQTKVGLKPQISGLRFEAWKACFARLTMTYHRDVRRDLTATRSKHYKQLIQAVQALEVALKPFQEQYDPEVWFQIGRLHGRSQELIEWSEKELARREDGGRPNVLVFERVIVHLLMLYNIVFQRKPS